MNEYRVLDMNEIEPIELCVDCPRTDFGCISVNTNQYNMCEGISCEEAYEYYRDIRTEELEPLKITNPELFI